MMNIINLVVQNYNHVVTRLRIKHHTHFMVYLSPDWFNLSDVNFSINM
jgi:hypothetical protein